VYYNTINQAEQAKDSRKLSTVYYRIIGICRFS